MKKAIHFGAGNIGRGFIGKILSDSNIHVTFTDVNQTIVNELHAVNKYPVKIASDTIKETWVENVDAILVTDALLTKLFTEINLITASVGANVLAHIAKNIAEGLIYKYHHNPETYLNIIACENMLKASSHLKELVLNEIAPEYHEWISEKIGFVDSAVDRIVPMVKTPDNILEVTVEEFSEWIVDGSQFKGPIPDIEGMQVVEHLMAFIERKLFTLNTGHAITAYLGNLFKVKTIREAIYVDEIRNIVKKAMVESGNVLIKRYNFDPTKHQTYIDKIINRFENKYIDDEIDRVARQPLRKLSSNDRLIKPLLGTIEYNTANDNLIIGIAAALFFYNTDDEQSVQLKEQIQSLGLKQAIKKITLLDDSLIERIIAAYNRFQQQFQL